MTTEQKKDWTTDYDIFDPGYVRDPFPVWDELRGKCPVAHTQRWGGSWMPTRYEDLFAMAQDIQHFSSQQVLVAPPGAGTEEGDAQLAAYDEAGDEFAGVAAPPITSDPPEHTWSRRLLLPVFSIRAIEKFEPLTREHCRALIARIIDRGSGDAAVDYAQQIPPYVIAAMLGVPRDMTSTFTGWVRDFLEFGLRDITKAIDARQSILAFMWQQIQERRSNGGGDDLLSYLVNAQVDGKPVPDTHILGTSFLILVAGIDTTWSSIGSAMWHLAQHPEHCERLIAEPELMPNAVEELLRAYSPVTMARLVVEDVDYNGCPMKAGDRLLMNFPAANRDPEKFPDPDEVILDRPENPHIAFGVGIHRCAGSNLARMEMRVAIQEWLAAIPKFRLEDPAKVTWAGGQVRGPRTLPVVLG